MKKLRLLIPLGSILYNFLYLAGFEIAISSLLPQEYLIFSHFTRMAIIFIIYLLFLFSQVGQEFVVWFIGGRKIIGREERKLEGLIQQLKDETDINGFTSTSFYYLKFLKLFKKNEKYQKMFATSFIKIFIKDQLDVDSISFGNAIILNKGAIDTLKKSELKALIYNEIMQVKYNISAKRLLHQSIVIMGRVSCIISLISLPFFAVKIYMSNKQFMNTVIIVFVFSLIRVVIWLKSKGAFTNLFYQFYELIIFKEADLATYSMGFGADMVKYLDKLYIFKIKKSFGRMGKSKLFSDVKPIVPYRINTYENLLGNNKNLNELNVNWSSNYIIE